jgi:hypothetical protein
VPGIRFGCMLKIPVWMLGQVGICSGDNVNHIGGSDRASSQLTRGGAHLVCSLVTFGYLGVNSWHLVFNLCEGLSCFFVSHAKNSLSGLVNQECGFESSDQSGVI